MEVEGFDSISKKLNTTYVESEDQSIEKIENQIEEFSNKKNELIQHTKNEKIETLEDKDFLQFEIKELINNSKSALKILQDNLKVGTSARSFEVYAKLLDAIINGLKELRELNKVVSDMKIFNDPHGLEDKPNVNINISGKDLLDMINNAKKNNELNKIQADFDVTPDENTKEG